MKPTEKYLEIYREMMFEYLKIKNENAPDFNKSKTRQLRNELAELDTEFEKKFKRDIRKFSSKDEILRSYLMDLYVNGFYRIRCTVNKHISVKEIESDNENEIECLNYLHSVRLICQEIREFLLLNLKIEIPKIDCSKYNIKGDYFGDFEISKSINHIEKEVEEVKKTKVHEVRKPTPRKRFIDLIEVDKKEGFKSKQKEFKDAFKSCGGKKLAYSCLALIDLDFLKQSALENKNALYDSYVKDFLKIDKDKSRGFSKYLNPKEKHQSYYDDLKTDIEDILKYT